MSEHFTSNIHICTTKTFREGIDIPAFKCFMCGKETMYASWTGSNCDTCKADSEMYPSDLIRTVREATKLTREQIAKELGYKPSTVKKYEWTHPSNNYFKKFSEFILDFYHSIED